jgi:hypothetical protein
VTTRLSLDRFEGKNKSIAVLVADDGTTLNVPKAFLPKGARTGDVLILTIERDAEETARLAAQTRQIQKDLKAKDPGGDLSL